MSYCFFQVLNTPLLQNIPRNCFIVSETLSKRNLGAFDDMQDRRSLGTFELNKFLHGDMQL